MEDKLGQEPAFPRTAKISENSGRSEYSNTPQKGISKRFYAAIEMAKGLLSNAELTERLDNNGELFHDLVSDAYSIADELLKQENK